MKRILAMLLLLAGVSTLCACGGDDETGSCAKAPSFTVSVR